MDCKSSAGTAGEQGTSERKHKKRNEKAKHFPTIIFAAIIENCDEADLLQV